MSALSWLAVLGVVGPERPAKAPSDLAFARPPVVAWERAVPAEPNPSPVRSERGAPVVRGDRLYLGASQENALLVLDARNGELVTRLPAGGPVMAAPVLGEDRIWYSDAAGYTRCLRLSDGHELWRHYAGAPVLDSPEVADGRVYLTTVDDVVYALDAETGALAWRHAQGLDPGRGVELELFGAPSPVVVGDLVLSGHSDGTLIALQRQDGELAWQRRVGEGRYPDLIAPALGADDAILVAGYAAPLIAIDPESRAVRWRLDEVGGAERMVLSEGVVYVSGEDGALRAIDVRTGELKWTWESGTNGTLTEPVLTEAGLLVGAAVGGLYLVDPATGAERWTLELGHLLDGVSAAPAVQGHEAWVLTNAGNLIHIVSPVPPAPEPRLRATGEVVPRGGG